MESFLGSLRQESKQTDFLQNIRALDPPLNALKSNQSAYSQLPFNKNQDSFSSQSFSQPLLQSTHSFKNKPELQFDYNSRHSQNNSFLGKNLIHQRQIQNRQTSQYSSLSNRDQSFGFNNTNHLNEAQYSTIAQQIPESSDFSYQLRPNEMLHNFNNKIVNSQCAVDNQFKKPLDANEHSIFQPGLKRRFNNRQDLNQFKVSNQQYNRDDINSDVNSQNRSLYDAQYSSVSELPELIGQSMFSDSMRNFNHRTINGGSNRQRIMDNHHFRKPNDRDESISQPCAKEKFDNIMQEINQLRVPNAQRNRNTAVIEHSSQADIQSFVSSIFPGPTVSIHDIKEEVITAISVIDLINVKMGTPIEDLKMSMQVFLMKLKNKIQKLLFKSYSSNTTLMSKNMLPTEKVQYIQQWLNSNMGHHKNPAFENSQNEIYEEEMDVSLFNNSTNARIRDQSILKPSTISNISTQDKMLAKFTENELIKKNTKKPKPPKKKQNNTPVAAKNMLENDTPGPTNVIRISSKGRVITPKINFWEVNKGQLSCGTSDLKNCNKSTLRSMNQSVLSITPKSTPAMMKTTKARNKSIANTKKDFNSSEAAMTNKNSTKKTYKENVPTTELTKQTASNKKKRKSQQEEPVVAKKNKLFSPSNTTDFLANESLQQNKTDDCSDSFCFQDPSTIKALNSVEKKSEINKEKKTPSLKHIPSMNHDNTECHHTTASDSVADNIIKINRNIPENEMKTSVACKAKKLLSSSASYNAYSVIHSSGSESDYDTYEDLL